MVVHKKCEHTITARRNVSLNISYRTLRHTRISKLFNQNTFEFLNLMRDTMGGRQGGPDVRRDDAVREALEVHRLQRSSLWNCDEISNFRPFYAQAQRCNQGANSAHLQVNSETMEGFRRDNGGYHCLSNLDAFLQIWVFYGL